MHNFFSSSRRRIMRVSLLLIMILALSACGGGSSSSSSSQPLVVAAIGDSIGNGFGNTGGWPGRLSSLLGVPVANNSQDGRIVRGGLGVVASVIATVQPSHLVVLLGANDANSGEDLNLSISSMADIVAICRNAGVIPIIATTIPNTASVAVNDRTAFLASGFAGLGNGAVIADVRAAFEGRPDLFLSDGLHPTAGGQQLIAEAMLAAF